MNNQTEERPHHPVSPSTLQSLEACPAFKSRSTQNLRSIIGTLSHKVTETKVDDNRLDDGDAELVASAMDFWNGRVELAKQRGSVTELSELYLPIDDCVFEDAVSTTAGYTDAGLIDHTEEYAELIDFKFGLWKVESADNNLQGMAYSLGLFKRYPKLETVRFWFHQPGIDHLTDAVFTRDNIAPIYLRIQTVVARARLARAQIAADDWSSAKPAIPLCNFCDNIGRCKPVLEIALKVSKKFSPLDIPEHITPTMILDPKQAGLAMRLATVTKIWSEAFRAQTTDRVLRRAADMPEGYKIESKQERSVVDSVKFKLCALQFMSESEYNELLDAPGFGKVEDVIKFKAPRGSKKASIDRFKDELEQSGAVEKSLPYSYLKVDTKAQ